MSTRFAVAALACGFTLLAAGAAAQDHGIDRGTLDESTPACRNFYQYANGGWLTGHPVPIDDVAWDNFRDVERRTDEQLKSILDGLVEPRKERSHTEQVLGDLYAAALNEAAIERAGLTPLKAEFAEIDAMRSSDDVVRFIRAHHKRGEFLVFRLAVDADLKDAAQALAYASQDGLALPDRDDYTRTDGATLKLREQYRDHVADQLQAIGQPAQDVRHQADAVVALETRLAEASLSRTERRDPASGYHPMSLAEANTVTPHFDWYDYFGSLGAAHPGRFSLAQPKFFAAFERALADDPIETWRAYLRWQVLHRAAPYLGKSAAQPDFDFFGRVLRGQHEPRPRAQRALSWVDQALGQALGQLYVARYFPAESRERARAMVEDLRHAAREHVERATWMAAPTREQALAKLDALALKIGYPDDWRDWSGLATKRDQGLLEQLRAIGRFETAFQVARLERPIDRNEWRGSPASASAYYRAQGNELVVPAGILVPPFFAAANDAALNYGSIGAIVGHELTHVYDDRGSQFDATGKLENWWTDADRNEFAKRAQALVKQYNALQVLPNLGVNGKLTLGENIADLGGLAIGYDALKLARARELAKGPRAAATDGGETPDEEGGNEGRSRAVTVDEIDGFTAEQRYFLAWARTWRRNISDAETRVRNASDPHAPAPFRVNTPLSNIGSFAGAFRCKVGDAMAKAKDQRVVVW